MSINNIFITKTTESVEEGGMKAAMELAKSSSKVS